jgi:SNF2 family DNA or RNA helicase
LCCGASPDQPGGFAPAQSLAGIVASAESKHYSNMRALKALDQTDMHVMDVTRTELGIHAHFLKVVDELRQDCSSSSLVDPAARQCPLCMDDACTILTACGHMYCWTCMFRTFRGAATTPCPYCRRLLFPGDVYQLLCPSGGLDQPSTGQKCVALVSMLSSLLMAHPQDSVAVYVAWSGMAQQLASVLENSGIAARGMGGNSRAVESALRAFEAGEVRVLVLPYDHGEGLTLVCANHVIIYHATSQRHNEIALSSVNRTGQTKPIHMYRFIAKGTLEALMNHAQ